MNFPSDFIPDNFVLGAVSLPMLFGCLGWQIGVIRTDWWSERPVAGRITGSLYHWCMSVRIRSKIAEPCVGFLTVCFNEECLHKSLWSK